MFHKYGAVLAYLVSRKKFLASAISALLLITQVKGAESEITYQSPDEKLGVRNFESGRVELVALPSLKTVLKLDLYGEIMVTWAPDSLRFTASEGAFDDDVQLYQPKVYERSAASFVPVKLPELTLPSAEWPGQKGRKAARGREFILAERWLDPNTLVLKRECLCNSFNSTGQETDQKEWSLSHEITLVFDGKHRASIQKVTKLEEAKPDL